MAKISLNILINKGKDNIKLFWYNHKSNILFAKDITILAISIYLILYCMNLLLANNSFSPIQLSIITTIIFFLVLFWVYEDKKVEEKLNTSEYKSNENFDKEILKMIDIERIGFTQEKNNEKKKSITDIIGEYVEDCFNRDVLFFRPYEKTQYISQDEEKLLLQELLDSAASNISPHVKEILGWYVNEDSVDKIIGRKCLQTITLFVADHNKHIIITEPIKY